VVDRVELKHDHLYYLYFREKPDKNLIIESIEQQREYGRRRI
jgi:hypothetical protein